MSKLVDETGKIYGRLRILSRSKDNDRGRARWICYCDPSLGGCGSETVVSGHTLRSGYTESCGCLKSDRISLAKSNPNNTEFTIQCCCCNQIKPHSEFNKKSDGKFGVGPKCKDCKSEESLFVNYKITKADKQKLLDSQDGKCWFHEFCGSIWHSKGPFVDHCHKTGTIRGILCVSCNTTLGHFEKIINNKDFHEEVLKYLSSKKP